MNKPELKQKLIELGIAFPDNATVPVLVDLLKKHEEESAKAASKSDTEETPEKAASDQTSSEESKEDDSEDEESKEEFDDDSKDEDEIPEGHVEHVVTEEDLIDNPEWAAEGIEVGDNVYIPEESDEESEDEESEEEEDTENDESVEEQHVPEHEESTPDKPSWMDDLVWKPLTLEQKRAVVDRLGKNEDWRGAINNK